VSLSDRPMMQSFLRNNRRELEARFTATAASSRAPPVTREKLSQGVPLFLDQLARMLEYDESVEPSKAEQRDTATRCGIAAFFEMTESSAGHGRCMLEIGFTTDQVVQWYVYLCQAIVDLARERDIPFSIEEVGTLYRCLGGAIADALREYMYFRDREVEEAYFFARSQQVGDFAHELRNRLAIVRYSFEAIKFGEVGASGAIGSMLERGLDNMETSIDQSINALEHRPGGVESMNPANLVSSSKK
jgi:signal transduction histidine kinase